MTKPTPAQQAFIIIIAVAIFATAVLMAIVERADEPDFSKCPLCGRGYTVWF